MFIVNIKGNVTADAINFFNGSKLNNSINTTEILRILYSSLISVQSRKHKLIDEDEKNQTLASSLRDKGIYAADESRQGRSGSKSELSRKSGELDIAIRDPNNYGIVISIIEAFELNSCGPKNSIVPNHIHKLIHRYDTSGNQNNYVVVYSMTKDFTSTWKKYKVLVEDFMLENGTQITEIENDVFNKSDVIVGVNEYERNNKRLSLYHLFIDMSVK